MLQAIRDSFVGWVAWGIVIIISVPFIVLGVTDFGSPARENTVAEVNGESISQRTYQQRYQVRRQSMQRQLGANYQPDLFDKQIQQSVVENLIEEMLLLKLAEEHKLYIGDDELSSVIRDDTTFQEDGKFNYDLYKSMLGQNGFTPDSYENYLRNELRVSTIPRLVRASSFVTPQEARRFASLLNQQRDFDYVVIGPDNISADVSVTDEEAREYYDGHASEFIRPEQVKIEYVRLSASQLADQVEASEENLRSYYEENADSFMVDEQRKASHILLALEDGKTLEESPEVASKLDEIQQQLMAGKDFGELAQQYSDDPGSAQQGGDLGQVLRGVMVPPFEKALFAMQEAGQISEPVRTSFGIHLIRLDEITPRNVKSFDEVKEQIKDGFVSKQAVDLYYDRSERIAEISYENPDSLASVAEAMELKIENSDWISANNDKGEVAGNRKVLETIFTDRMKTEMTNSDPIEIGDSDMVIVRVTDSRPQSQLPFEDVVEQARQAAQGDIISKRMQAYADDLKQRLLAGESLQAVADAEKLQLETMKDVARQSSSLPPALSRGVFAMKSPGDTGPVIDILPVSDNKLALVNLHKVVLPDASQVDQSSVQSLASRDASQDAQMLLTGLRENAEVTIFKDKL